MNERNTSLNGWINNVKDETTQNYINIRIIPQMAYYSTKSQQCKAAYMKWMKVSIFIGILIPVASIFADGSIAMKAIIAFLGASSAAITSYLSLQNYQKLWENYRSNRELTLSILLAYFTNSGEFSEQKTDEERNALLVDKCEMIFTEETGVWKDSIRSQ